MLENLINYNHIIEKAGRLPDALEFMAWSFYGIEPEWFRELVKETV